MNKVMNKLIIAAVVAIVAIGLIGVGGIGYNVDEEFTVIQYPWGQMTVKDDAGMYLKAFGRTNVYPDKDIIYFSKDTREGSTEDESIETLFTDKGRGWWSFQVTVNNPSNEPDQLEFHKMCRGDYDYFRDSLNARLKSASREYSEKKTASEAAENQSTFVSEVEAKVKIDEMIDTQFHSTIIAVELTGVEFDKTTKSLFAKQQEALLLKKQAQIDSEKFVQQTLSTKAEYEQKIAKQKGEADMIAMKATTDAQREKELAEIEASKRVSVAEYAKAEAAVSKDTAEINATKLVEVAKLERLAADENAEAQKLLADARKYELEIGGAISEQDKVLAEIAAKRDAMVAAELAKIQVPKIVISGGAGQGEADMTTNLINIKLLEGLGILDKPVASSK